MSKLGTLCGAMLIFPMFVYGQAASEHHIWQEKRTFEPLSQTAQSITGFIRLSGNPAFAQPGSKMRIAFGNGKEVDLTSVGASWRNWDDSSPKKVTAEVFQLDHDPGRLANGNTLCGNPQENPARYIVFHESYLLGQEKILGLAVFGSEQPPSDINSPGLCATFSFYVE